MALKSLVAKHSCPCATVYVRLHMALAAKKAKVVGLTTSPVPPPPPASVCSGTTTTVTCSIDESVLRGA